METEHNTTTEGETMTLIERLESAKRMIQQGGRGVELGRREIVFVKQELDKVQTRIDAIQGTPAGYTTREQIVKAI